MGAKPRLPREFRLVVGYLTKHYEWGEIDHSLEGAVGQRCYNSGTSLAPSKHDLCWSKRELCWAFDTRRQALTAGKRVQRLKLNGIRIEIWRPEGDRPICRLSAKR
jgi:hypothetical protein